MDAFQQSTLQAFVQSPLMARGNNAAGLILYLATDFATATEDTFQYGLRLVAAADKSRSASTESVASIEVPYPHPPKLPKDFPTFKGGALVELFYHNPLDADPNSEISVFTDTVDFSEQGIYYGTEVQDQDYDYPDWTIFKDPAGVNATNPSYDKTANAAKPTFVVLTLRATLLDKDGNPVAARDATGAILTNDVEVSVTRNYAPTGVIWTKAQETVTVSGGSNCLVGIGERGDGSSGSLDVVFGAVSINSATPILLQTVVDGTPIGDGYHVQFRNDTNPENWCTYTFDPDDGIVPSGPAVTSLDYSAVTNVGVFRSVTAVTATSINPSPDSTYWAALFSTALPSNTYTTVSTSGADPTAGITQWDFTPVIGLDGGTLPDYQPMSLVASVNFGSPAPPAASWAMISQGWFNTESHSINVAWQDYEALRSHIDSYISDLIIKTQACLDSIQNPTFTPYYFGTGHAPFTPNGINTLTLNYLGQTDNPVTGA